MRRRALLAACIATALGAAISRAQQPKIARVGVLSPADTDATPIFEAFRRGLRELGYIEGRNIILEYRFTHGDYSALPRLAEELAMLPVDIIVTDGPSAAQAAANASRTIPIVMGVSGGDPVALGLVASLARPGGNVTGFTLMFPELSVKNFMGVSRSDRSSRRAGFLLDRDGRRGRLARRVTLGDPPYRETAIGLLGWSRATLPRRSFPNLGGCAFGDRRGACGPHRDDFGSPLTRR
jgi:hypothetical protein